MALEPLIVIKNLDIVYNLGKSNEFYAIKGANAEVYPEEFIIFFGPSGCGKSTILYCLLGALPLSSGELLVKGENPYTLSSKKLVDYQRNTVGIIYQAFNLIPSLTVLDNISLPQIFAEIPANLREDRSMALLKRFGIDSQARKLPLLLSGGQQQRVAVSRSLINNPEIVLADEPVGNLDAVSRAAVMNTLFEINKQDKKTVILVTHDARHLPYAHRVYYLKDGFIEREVVNPEREQIKKVEKKTMIVTEIEKLARIYPYLTPEELRVKSVVNYLIEDLNFEQIEKLEKTVQTMMEGKMDEESFYKTLSATFEEGGIGLSSCVAEKMAEKIKKVIEESRNIARYRRHMMDEYYPKQKTLLYGLRTMLLDQYEGDINLTQLRRLDEALEKRIAGKIQKEEFQKQLNLAIDKGGIGFTYKASRNFTRHLEKLIAQGAHL